MSGQPGTFDMNGDDPVGPNGSGAGSPMNATAAGSNPIMSSPVDRNGAPANAVPKAVEDVMYSEIGITTLLARLKQSIASAREFATFLQKRSKLEEDQATGLKRLAKSQLETIERSEFRGGSYAGQLAEVMRTHDRMADNGMQFALSLHQMHEDLNVLSNNMERGRKQCKHEGLDAEKRASDAEAAMHKAKGRYDGLADDYDRARTGDTKGSRRMGLKGPKSQEQYESDLQRKLQAADADYEEKVRMAKTQREALLNEHRPRAVRTLKELCRECDSGLTLQLQKFATFNEKLLLGNGLAISPLAGEGFAQKSMSDVVRDIDNDRDFHSYVSAHANKVPPRPSEIKYEQHPTLRPKTQQPLDKELTVERPPTIQQPQPAPQQPTLSVNTTSSQPSSMNGRYNSQPPPGPLVAPSQMSSYTQPLHQPQPTQDYDRAPAYGPPPPTHSSYSPQHEPLQDSYKNPPYPMHPSERTPTYQQPPAQQSMVSPIQQRDPGYNNVQTPSSATPTGPSAPMSAATQTQQPPAPTNNLPALRPTFGVSLQSLFDRDASAVPLVVIQCILAVDHFGLETTGIYRQSGTTSQIQSLISRFNHNPSSVDFRNPANFYHDVHIPAGLLKQFFKQLPDPLVTGEKYGAFLEAGKIEGVEGRRDALHGLINELPDPNYATLRALVLHLWRVMQNESRNRMGSGNLAMCFAPSLMGTHTGDQIADAGLQTRVLDTILVNATAIFDED
ncbi:hypothetical protein BAUCODRAFT_32140 [Baudoinia panamericana UAMH 10762]|uniref:Rho-GAP domain-containing protein n=1 Tax=Baudoinia panamericana (strain UAMH 10762) TaxID=717646 RepID=M2N2I9_BAUPA|nr:uncharacterized protein BAUCODRAFT_32140 [Baudoinia panamericana UAMH 10762]EMC98143.1 hypothetical protein BAUCODRAFT_32140 [Baudoinia panamericana UAMH 10762]